MSRTGSATPRSPPPSGPTITPNDLSGAGRRVNEILREFEDGWWADTAMVGIIERVPPLLKTIIPVFESFFGGGRIDPHIFEIM